MVRVRPISSVKKKIPELKKRARFVYASPRGIDHAGNYRIWSVRDALLFLLSLLFYFCVLLFSVCSRAISGSLRVQFSVQRIKKMCALTCAMCFRGVFLDSVCFVFSMWKRFNAGVRCAVYSPSIFRLIVKPHPSVFTFVRAFGK